jgi:F-type H+-transporting ATPase subunit c
LSNVLAQAADALAQQPVDHNPGLAVIGYGLAAIGAGIGVGMIFSSVINGTARQPEVGGRLMGMAFTTFALVEVLALIGFVLFLLAT